MKHVIAVVLLTLAIVVAVVIANRPDSDAKREGPPPALPNIDVTTPEESSGTGLLTNPDGPLNTAQPQEKEEPIEGPPPDAGVDEIDGFIYEQLQKDGDPQLEDILSRDNLIRKMVTATDLTARGQNPIKPLPFLRFNDSIQVEDRDGRLFLSETNFQRYDPYVASISRLDGDNIGQIYRLLLPFIDKAYAELGNQTTWQETVDAAFESILAYEPPTQARAVELIGKDGVFIYADPDLEKLPPVHKAFLRMGPDNAAKLQTLARRFRNQIANP